jgi:hypothetical protein
MLEELRENIMSRERHKEEPRWPWWHAPVIPVMQEANRMEIQGLGKNTKPCG